MRELCERIKTNINSVNESNKGVAAIEVILILVEKPNAKHRYVLCGN